MTLDDNYLNPEAPILLSLGNLLAFGSIENQQVVAMRISRIQ